MTTGAIAAVVFIALIVSLVLTVPIGFSLGIASLAYIFATDQLTLGFVARNMVTGTDSFPIMAIPFFVFAGELMGGGGISKRLLDVANVFFGRIRGGLAIVTVVVCMFFAAISGSGPATVAALGMVLIPAMIERGGFSAPFATALMATSSSIAIVIPPSIAFVVYASITGVSIADMFTAGIVPGILMGVALVIVVLLEAKKHNIQPTQKKATAKERWDAFKDAFWGFLMPVIILGGIYGSVFTPTAVSYTHLTLPTT